MRTLTYALQIVAAGFIGRACLDSTPIVGGASCPAFLMKHRITTPHRSKV